MDRRFNQDIKIKFLTFGDKNKWQNLWQCYLNFYQTDLPQSVTDHTWQNITNNNSTIYGFGAWQGNNGSEELVGFVHIVLHPNTWNTTDCCYLEDLFVSENLRGKGLGRALIEYVYDFAKSENCNRVYWVTNAENKTAQYLYEKIANKTNFIQFRHTL